MYTYLSEVYLQQTVSEREMSTLGSFLLLEIQLYYIRV